MNTADFNRFLYNLLLWTPGKGTMKETCSQGYVYFQDAGDRIHGYATDDYVAIRETLYITGLSQTLEDTDRLVILNDQLKELEKMTREDDEHSESYWIEQLTGRAAEIDVEFWDMVVNSIEGVDIIEDDVCVPTREFAIAPDRFSKFSLLQPRDTYPVDFLPSVHSNGSPVIRWKHGPTTTGLLQPLDREYIKDLYKAEVGVLWET